MGTSVQVGMVDEGFGTVGRATGGAAEGAAGGVAEGARRAGIGGDEVVSSVVHVQMVVNRSVGEVWQVLVSSAGTAAWLGEGAVLGEKGQSFHCDDGTAGVVRSFHPLEQLRLSWHADIDSEPTLIELDVTPVSGGTRLRVWHEGLPAGECATMQDRWEHRLAALARLSRWETLEAAPAEAARATEAEVSGA